MKHFLDIHKTDATELRAMIDSAHAMKTARNGRPKGSPDDDQPLKGRMVALIFEKPSTRTRVSFDVGVRQMGGETMVLSGKEMQLGHGETIADNHPEKIPADVPPHCAVLHQQKPSRSSGHWITRTTLSITPGQPTVSDTPLIAPATNTNKCEWV